MLRILKNIFANPWALSIAGGTSVFLAFETFGIVPVLILFPVFSNQLVFQTRSSREAFGFGFFTSFIIMLGGFYWVTYVIHEFGGLSWFTSGLLFLGFCGFGALNFPVFTLIAHSIRGRFLTKQPSVRLCAFWFLVGFPALFTLIEWLIPKLFPWYLGHALYRQLWLIQFCEITGASFLTFAIFSLGSTLGWCFFTPPRLPRPSKRFLLFPLSIFLGLVSFSFWTLKIRTFELLPPLRIALIQANIGNLDKLSARQGVLSRVDLAIENYKTLSNQALASKPDLFVWPETAIPFRVDLVAPRQQALLAWVKELGVPLISGGYAQSQRNIYRDYNAAFLIDPKADPILKDIYYKNILLAFGEYLPLGDAFPQLYQLFPQVSDFERGKETKAFTTSLGLRLGISICYEAIVPSFMRRVAQEGVQGFINLTNDSWFGPTSEPYLHGALTVFRSIEHRLPLVRVTNTGASFTVSHLGEMSQPSRIYEPEFLIETVRLQAAPHKTFYTQYGDWFILVLLGILIGFFFLNRGKSASVSH